MIEVMFKLQEKVDEENPIAQRIMNRINPVIREKYIQSIVTLTPKKEKPSIIKVNPKINDKFVCLLLKLISNRILFKENISLILKKNCHLSVKKCLKRQRRF